MLRIPRVWHHCVSSSTRQNSAALPCDCGDAAVHQSGCWSPGLCAEWTVRMSPAARAMPPCHSAASFLLPCVYTVTSPLPHNSSTPGILITTAHYCNWRKCLKYYLSFICVWHQLPTTSNNWDKTDIHKKRSVINCQNGSRQTKLITITRDSGHNGHIYSINHASSHQTSTLKLDRTDMILVTTTYQKELNPQWRREHH